MSPKIWPVYIPSKGRPGGKTMSLLADDGVPFTLVVEPQDEAAYRRQWPRVDFLILGANDKGLPFSRNSIKAVAYPDWFWMLDDDIEKVYKTVNKRNVPASVREAMEYVAGLVDVPQAAGLGQVALEYQQFAWRSPQPFVQTGYCDVFVAVHGGRTKALWYVPELALKEDRDFTLQVLASGLQTARITRYSFSAPKNGSNAGGLFKAYAETGRELAVSKKMIEKWGPDVCKLNVKADGRPDIAINWKHFKKLRGVAG